MLAAISLIWPEQVADGEGGAAVDRDDATPVEGDLGAEAAPPRSADVFEERDLLFDVLSIGAVVATVALVLFFW
jgi:hypothetical protein